jgi:hypothetical protein
MWRESSELFLHDSVDSKDCVSSDKGVPSALREEDVIVVVSNSGCD